MPIGRRNEGLTNLTKLPEGGERELKRNIAKYKEKNLLNIINKNPEEEEESQIKDKDGQT